MEQLNAVDINTAEYWDGQYRERKFPTFDANNRCRYACAAGWLRGTSALDIGCGQGGLGWHIAAAGHSVAYIGCDHSREAIRDTVYPEGLYVCCDWRSLSGKADTVYLLETAEHMQDPKALVDHAASLARLRLVVGVPIFRHFTPQMHRGEHMWDIDTDELERWLEPWGAVLPSGKYGADSIIIGVDRDR